MIHILLIENDANLISMINNNVDQNSLRVMLSHDHESTASIITDHPISLILLNTNIAQKDPDGLSKITSSIPNNVPITLYSNAEAIENLLAVLKARGKNVEQPSPVIKSRNDAAPSSIKDQETTMIIDALKSCRTRTEAAALLEISPRTLRYKIAKLKDQGFDID